MKQLSVTKVTAKNVAAENVPDIMNMAGINYNLVECVDWKHDFPYKPKMSFAIAYTNDEILIHYCVEEKCIRAVAPHDNGKVWEDSCCEFFVQPIADGSYYNFECNCVGTLLIGFGHARENRQLAPDNILRRVTRWSSMGRKPFDNKDGNFKWQMSLVIPFTSFFMHDVKTLNGQKVMANFYKCGDKTSTPHFISWNKIDVLSPDFHRPEFFGELDF